MMENADEFDSECSEYVTFAPSVLQLDESGTEQRSAPERCIQVHYFRSVAAAARPDRAPVPRVNLLMMPCEPPKMLPASLRGSHGCTRTLFPMSLRLH